MYQCQKRDGKVVPFHINKISGAITKAFEAMGKQFHPSVIDMLALRVTSVFEDRIKDGLIAVEDIQDCVEQVLSDAGYADVAKAYILYRKQREKVRNLGSTLLDYQELVDNYLKINDWRVKENSTVTYSVGGLILSNSGAITANYWLSEVYDPEIAEAHRSAAIHLHDLSMLTGYCAGWSLKQLIQEGLGGVPGKITSAPASHLSTLCNQMVNFLGIMQNEWAGAQAFSSFDTYLAPFVKVDHLTQKEVKQAIQGFVYGVNTPSRWGTQAPFSNITLDWVVPDDLRDLPCIVGGKEMDFTYGDCQREMDMVNKAFIEIMIEGDANGRGFQYPIPTYSITRNFDWSETENNKLLFEMTAKYGTPYFSNYINSDMQPSDVRSMCCRLRLDLRELRKKSGGFFGSGESTGSVGVVTINMPRIAYLAEDEADFYNRLDKLMDIAARSLKTKRTVITKLLDNGLYPYTKRYLGTFANHFSTIGLIGMNEVGLNAKWLRKDLTHPETQRFAREVLDHMRERLSDYQEQYGDLYNLEATPAESTTYRFAKHDKEQYPEIITANENGTPYYTNSSHLPVGYTEDIFTALEIQDELQTRYTSGTVFHAFLGEKLPDWRAAANLVRKIANNFKLPYYTMSPTYSVCAEHGYLAGEQFSCPHCGKATEVYSRITGYYRPVQNWNDGKAQEFKDRRTYDIANSVLRRAGVAGSQVTVGAGFSRVATLQPTVVSQQGSGFMVQDSGFRVQGSGLSKVTPDFVGAQVLAEFTEQGSESAKNRDDLAFPVREGGPTKLVDEYGGAGSESSGADEVRSAMKEVLADALGMNNYAKTSIVENDTDRVMLFATKTCPNCVLAERLLQIRNVEFDKILAEENKELAEKYGVKQAPTLIAGNQRIVGLGEIRKFVVQNMK